LIFIAATYSDIEYPARSVELWPYCAVILYRVSQEEKSIFWEVIESIILSRNVHVHASYFEGFPR
jgi:predicted membrane protein